MPTIRRSAVLRGAATALASTALAACGAQGSPSSQPVATVAPAKPAVRATTLLLQNDWTSGDRLKIIEAWVARANKVYPHIKTDLAANADTQEKIIASFAADQQGDLVMVDQHLIPVFGPKNVLEDITSTMATLKFDFKVHF